MKTGKLFAVAASLSVLGFAGGAKADTLTGAGSTFIAPILQKWAAVYAKKTGTPVNYQAIGSGGGINALTAQTVDFAGSDVPMTAAEKAKAGSPILTIPDILGAVVVAYNIPGIGPGIGLSGPVIADIYQGKITYWDDPRITKLSPGVKFPHQAIIVVHRADGSGTSFIFTEYLSKVSPAWKSGPGTGKSVEWPVGLGGKGNAGVAGTLHNKPYSIGYVELAYAVTNAISYAKVQNAKGKLIYPSLAATAAAGVGLAVPDSLELSATNSPNAASYPIVGASYLLLYANAKDSADAKKFVKWVLTEGQSPDFTKPLYYAPVSPQIRAKALKALGQ
jgi:phosphate transport system substrate-binding protein